MVRSGAVLVMAADATRSVGDDIAATTAPAKASGSMPRPAEAGTTTGVPPRRGTTRRPRASQLGELVGDLRAEGFRPKAGDELAVLGDEGQVGGQLRRLDDDLAPAGAYRQRSGDGSHRGARGHLPNLLGRDLGV